MRHTEHRKRLRKMLAGSECLVPAGVYDPLSARVAEDVGYQLGILVGSEATRTVLAAPDLNLITLSEFADQVRRITRISNLSLIVDGNDGFGGALNAMRTVQEMENAGASGLMIEDIALRFGKPDGAEELVSIREMVGKLRAMVEAREDPELVLIARTRAFKGENTERAVERAIAYKAAGVDALFLSGPTKIEHFAAVYDATRLPIISGTVPPDLSYDDLAKHGVRVVLGGHHEAVEATAKALREVYTHLLKGGKRGELKSKVSSQQEMDELGLNWRGDQRYKKWQQDYSR